MKLLIVGGYGTFGGRIVQLLENEPRLTIMVAGRSLGKAAAWCGHRGSVAARLMPAVFDRDGDPAAQLASLRPDTLVDASGPFQAYGEGCYRLVEACIEQGVNYFDLADGSDFVAGMPAFDAVARRAGLFVLSGAHRCGGAPALIRHGAGRQDQGRHRAVALCRRRRKRHPRHRGLRRTAGHAAA
ncbi:saccharopine dehydrogenase NADP-binding domain-containing protein, partial [Mesorhizobium sp. Cs1321R2N1]|uniref:saccharopine dehydrogenase NADP-binding domain-containing protein n=1 Tax=Mesorhizobium sp. Cs1321R2N1 TaxID=3015174 RepID=UPI00301E4692